MWGGMDLACETLSELGPENTAGQACGRWAAAAGGESLPPDLRTQAIRVPIEIPQSEILKLFPPSQRTEIERKREVLATIAYFIGKDFKMPVKLGMPGGGWYWDEAKNEIRVDPQDLLEMSYDACRFIVGHEGGHRRISRAEVISERLMNTTGYMLLTNIIEDPRVNNFVVDAYPTFQKPLETSFIESTKKRLQMEAEGSLGCVPRIMQAGFLLLRYWFEEATGKKLPEEAVPDEIREAVERVLPAARRAWSVYPSKKEAEEGEETVLRYARTSNAIIEKLIWPHFKDLVAQDIRDQLIQEILQQVNAQTGGGGIPSNSPGSSPGQGQSGGGAGPPGDTGDPGAEASGGILQKLSKLLGGVLGGGGISNQAELPGKSNLLERLRQRLEEGAASSGAKDSEGNLSGPELLDALRRALSDKDISTLNAALKEAREIQEMREITEEIFGDAKRDNSDTPAHKAEKMAAVSLESLSKDFKLRLESIIKFFESKEGERLIGRAFGRLKEFERKASAELQGKLRTGEDQLPGFKYQKSDPNFGIGGGNPVNSDEYIGGSGKGNIRLDHPRWEGKREGFLYPYRALPESETCYIAARAGVIPLINRLETELREIFRERRARKWEDGKRYGPTFNLRRRIREIARRVPAVETESFRKRERPTEKDYAITLLIDLSGSMNGPKIEETFKAAVILCEVLGRLSIKTEILGFNSYLYEYKPFHLQMSERVRARMGSMLRETGRRPAHYNDDGWALAEASARLAKERTKEKFLIVLSDGCPAPSDPHAGPEYSLSKIISEIRENTDQKLVGLGVGPDTHHVEAYYPNHMADIRVADLPGRLAKFLKEVIEDYQKLKR